jgi:hypothetical protein
VIRVGKGGEALAVSIAAGIAKDGDVVEIEAGEYRGDVAVWLQKRLTIRSVGGPVRMIADGKHAEGKAIWVLRNGEFDISGIQFEGVRVPDENGAGIRFERGRLRLSNCRFIDNECGLLTGNDGDSELWVDGCQFSGMFARPPRGHRHNLYVGAIDRCVVSASYFSRAQVGHLLKTRARRSEILYNRITDEDGCASYELDFPDGGDVVLLGNLIVQEPGTEHARIVAYGAESYRWPVNRFVMAHNTVVSRGSRDATFVRVFPGPIRGVLRNNVFVGKGRFGGAIDDPDGGNVMLADERSFRSPKDFDFHLRPGSTLMGAAGPPDASLPPGFDGLSLVPTHEYVHPMSSRRLASGLKPSPGAFHS